MKTLNYLQKITEGERSLVITCLETGLDIEQRLKGQVFRFTALGNILNLKDDYQVQSILNFVEFKNCTKIIIAGHTDCRVLNSLLYHPVSDKSPLKFAKLNLSEIFSNNHCHMLRDSVKDQILIEQNIITQCRNLLEFEPFAERLRKGTLEIIGLLLGLNNECKQLFSHRISYNNIVAMN